MRLFSSFRLEKPLIFLLASFGVLLASSEIKASSVASAQPLSLTNASGWDTRHMGGYITATAMASDGSIWAATEENGVWRFDPSAKTWTQFTAKNTPCSSNLRICLDILKTSDHNLFRS